MITTVLLQAPLQPDAVRDTITRIVTEERGYFRNVSSTLLSRAWEWLSRLVRDLFVQATGSRGTYLITLSLLGLLLIGIIVRSVIVARARRQAAARRATEASADDLLGQARGLVAQGVYIEAAHLLYAAVVARLAEARAVRRHPSKTVGDYYRDLRQAGHDVTPAYRAFAQLYDVVAYGDGLCDAVRYARLEQLALPVLQLVPAAATSPSARAA